MRREYGFSCKVHKTIYEAKNILVVIPIRSARTSSDRNSLKIFLLEFDYGMCDKFVKLFVTIPGHTETDYQRRPYFRVSISLPTISTISTYFFYVTK